ncbi:MAG: hypothetical protein HWE14_08210, partial [Flavobacteriia bacterium]|nr:hypothetical protein [Flavobacteriia bacterium]
ATPVNTGFFLSAEWKLGETSANSNQFLRAETGYGRFGLTDTWVITTPDQPDGTGETADAYYFFNYTSLGLKYRMELDAVENLSIGGGLAFAAISKVYTVIEDNYDLGGSQDITKYLLDGGLFVQYDFSVYKGLFVSPSLEARWGWSYTGLSETNFTDARISGIYLAVRMAYRLPN